MGAKRESGKLIQREPDIDTSVGVLVRKFTYPVSTALLARVLAIVALTAIGYSLPSHGVAAGTRYALLIGINDYQALPALNGSLNDVETMRELLVNRYEFDPDNVTVLTDTQATRQGILDALKALVARTGPDDIVYIHYSGHGSQVEDLNGDEADGADETICPRDARTPGIPDITDDEIDAIISGFKTPSVFVVMDSCHSGTVLRSTNSRIRPRFVPPDERIDLYRKGPGGIKTRAVVSLPETEGYLLITGAAANQSALDGPFDKGRFHGLLTYSLSRSLLALPRNASPVQIMDQIKRQIAGMQSQLEGNPVPEPQLEASRERLELPFLAITGELQEADESHIQDKITVFLRNMSGAIRARLEKDLPAQVDGLSILGTDTGNADFVVDCGSSASGSGWRCQVGDDQSGYEKSEVDASPETMAIKLAGLIRKQQFIDAMRSLDGQPSILQLDFRNASAGQVSMGYRGVTVSHENAPARVHFYRPGTPRTPRNSLQIEVDSSHDCYLTLAYLDSGGGLQVIFPDPEEGDDFYPEGLIHKDMTARIPDSLLDDSRAGFHWDFGPPAGDDVVYAFCMTEMEQASALREGIQVLSAQTGAAVNESLLELFPNLSAASPAIAARGIRVAQNNTALPGDAGNRTPRRNWNMAYIRLQVVE
jgi:hypothetical protein